MDRLLISIPVHEQPEVVYDQIANIHRFVPEATVVLHVSGEFRKPLLGLRASRPLVETDRVLVNPVSQSSADQGLLNIHLANYRYGQSRGAFDWFLINASNDMYVRPGVGDYVTRYDAVARPVPLTPTSTWRHYKPAMNHPSLQAIAKAIGAEVCASTPEGTAYPKAFMDEAVDLLQRRMPYERAPRPYPDEETVLPTIASAWASTIGLPFVLSEVTIGRTMSEAIVDEVRAGSFHAPAKAFYGPDGVRVPYADDGIYAVKRVARRLNDGLRRYIRELP